MEIPLYLQMAVFALLLASPQWRFTAFAVLVGAVSNAAVLDDLDAAIKAGKITYESYWVYGAIDVITALIILSPSLKIMAFDRIFWGAKAIGVVLCGFVVVHLFTSIDYALWENGYIDKKYLHWYYLQVCFILNLLQLMVGIGGIPSALRSIGSFIRRLVCRGGLVGVYRDIMAELRKRSEDREGLHI